MWITLLLIIFIQYILLITLLLIGFESIAEIKTSNGSNPSHQFSIIVVFKNEAAHLNELLNSFKELNYPKNLFEVILIDDNSSDNSKSIVNEFIKQNNDLNISVFDNQNFSNAPKKDGIELGVQKAKNEWIITTDADCLVPKTWLLSFDQFLQKNPELKMICAPVKYNDENTILNQFQNIEFLSYQATTIGTFGLKKPIMCNGANMAFSKKAFVKINGYTNVNHIASGDDVFLLEKMIRKYKTAAIGYLKSSEAIVITSAVHNLKQLINQRIRWGAKTSFSKNKYNKRIGLSVLLTNVTILILPILCIFEIISFKQTLLLFISKVLLDTLLVYKSAQFFKKKISIKTFIISCIVYPVFNSYCAVRGLSQPNSKWK